METQNVPYIVLVAAGKGGVGKTTVASDIARTAKQYGYNVGMVDADISTPNSPEVVAGGEVDTSDQRLTTGSALKPPTVNGIQVMSQGLILDDETAVLRDGEWRAQTVAEYLNFVEWDSDTDLIVVDTPPGTGEELQVIASEAPPDYALIVTTPHPSSLRDATKTHSFFEKANATHRTVVNMAFIPGEDIAQHVAANTDFTEVRGVGKSTQETVAEVMDEQVPDLPLFGYVGGVELPYDGELAATVPYTTDFEKRQAVYTEALNDILEDREVEQ